MKRLLIVLPLTILLAYCSGPNNTQITTETEMNVTSTTASTTTTEANDETTTTIAPATTTQIETTSTSPLPLDENDPMYQHWQRTNGQYWTWDLNYPGYDRPTAGSYDAAMNGNWQLVMTPELATAWSQDNSRSLWMGQGETYISASESFNTQNNMSGTNLNSSNSITSTHGLNNSASGNATVANQMNGSIANGSVNTTVSAGVPATTSNSSNGTNVSTSTRITGDANAGMTGSMDINSINYNAANGNMYQLPKFNLFLDNGSFTGYTGCNNISGRVEVTGTGLRFLNTNTSTVIECMGGMDEAAFVNMLRKVDSYSYVGDELQLMQGNQVLLKFRKSNSHDTGLK